MNRRSALVVLATAPVSALLAQSEPWKPSDVMDPKLLAARLTSNAPKPPILYVGFPVLYRSTRIPGAVLAGPGGRPEGLDLLKSAVAAIPKNKEVVIYCGCCPFPQCPNVRPAFKALSDWGYSNVKLLMLPTNLATDWVAKGYPTEKTANAPKF